MNTTTDQDNLTEIMNMTTDQDNLTEIMNMTTESLVTTTIIPKNKWMKDSLTIIRWCFVPFIIIGTLTNIINIMVFIKPKMRSLSTGNFLLALTVADLGSIYFQVR